MWIKKEQKSFITFVYSLESEFIWQCTDYYCNYYYCFSQIISFFCLEIFLAFIKWPYDVPAQVITIPPTLGYFIIFESSSF